MCKSQLNYVLYIEPYVHIFSDDDCILLYNTSTATSLECRQTGAVDTVIRRLQAKRNLHSTGLTGRELQKSPDLKRLVAKIKDGYFGDLLPKSLLKKNPAHFIANICIQKDIKRLKRVSPERKGTGLLSYINEIFLFINSQPCSAESRFPDGYRQFPYSLANGKNHIYLDFETIQHLLSNLAASSLGRVNILGGNVFEHPELPRILAYLSNLSHRKRFYINLDHRPKEEDIKAIINLENAEVELLVSIPGDKKLLFKVTQWLQGKTFRYNFLVESEKDVALVSKIAAEQRIRNYQFRPYYNGNNLAFFENYVFISKEDILSCNVSEQDILARQAINPFNFGKLYVLNDGTAYANVNRASIGNIKRDSVKTLILQILDREKSWTRTRKHVTPCKCCRFHALCPPISNYDYFFRRYNLCHLK